MARYTALFTIGITVEDLHTILRKVLGNCSLEVIYDTPEYMMGREIPGKVPFPKLATVEVLIDRTNATDREVRVQFVMKNEELPLQVNNHCKQMFETLLLTITNTDDWKVIETVSGS
ncbi:MAG: hypothetical protein VKJ24_01240 [Synechococcales bacterium]|nr:hypothetical protein [Synechococcales bacterium]